MYAVNLRSNFESTLRIFDHSAELAQNWRRIGQARERHLEQHLMPGLVPFRSDAHLSGKTGEKPCELRVSDRFN